MSELPSGFFAALSQALLASLWQGAIIGVAAAASLRSMRKNTPHARYLVACLALASCVVLPMLTFVSGLVAEEGMRAELVRTRWIIMMTDGLTPGFAQIHLRDWEPYLVWSWFAGCSLLLARSAAAVAWLEHAMRKPQPASQRVWQLRIDSLAAQMGVARTVRLLLSSDLSSPAVANIARPVVFLPIAVTARMPVEWVEALLAHELAHIRRHDYLINLIQKLSEAVLFHQPAIWWLSSRIRHERELIADSIAVEAGFDRRTLAAALAELVELREDEALLPDLALSARGGRLMSRIRSLVRPAAPVAIGHAVIPATALLAVVVILLIGTSLGRRAEHAATRADPVVALRLTGAAVPSLSTVQVGTVLGSDTGMARSQVAPDAKQPMQVHQREALVLQARLAPLGELSRKMGEVSAPMEVLGTRMAELDTRQSNLADSDFQGRTP